jgi:aminobenzoyl-glutamate utilization protein B
MAKMSQSEIKASAVEWIDANNAALTLVSRQIWEFAELAFHEFKTSDLLVKELKAAGFTVERGQARMPTAFVGTFRHGSGKPVVGFVAEYDAMPGTNPDNPGQPGHSCGHNLFGTASVAAGIACKEAMARHQVGGTLKVFGTPAEENAGAKLWMIREKVFDDCDVIITWHPQPINQVAYGGNLALVNLEINFYGRSAHPGTEPEKGRSALDGLQLFTIACEFLREHMIDEMKMHYIITHGGKAPNAVPDYAQCRLILRGPTMADIETVFNRDGGLQDCAKGAALATGTRVEIRRTGGHYEEVPSKSGAYVFYENMKTIGAPTYTEEEVAFARTRGYEEIDNMVYEPANIKIRASHDTGDLSWVVPTLCGLCTTCMAKGTPGHSLDRAVFSGMSIGEKGMIYAAKIMSSTALDLLLDPTKLGQVVSEWKERIKNNAPYQMVLEVGSRPPVPEENPPGFEGPSPPPR